MRFQSVFSQVLEAVAGYRNVEVHVVAEHAYRNTMKVFFGSQAI